jgi:lysozyme
VIRRVSPAGRELIKRHEGLRLEAYPDPASGGDPWTIGYGHTHGVKKGDRITAEQADAFLAYDLAWVEEAIAESVRVPISQDQFDALASLIFNIGAGAFRNSTLLRRLNAGDHIGAAGQFERWVRAAGKVMPGLVKRRAEEAALFRAGMSAHPAPVNAPTAPPAPSTPLVQPGPEPADYYAPSGEAPEWVPPSPKGTTMAPFVAAALPAIIQPIPQLGRLFGSGSEVAQRNVAAAEAVVGIVQQAVGASNAQEAAELVQSDPQARQKAQQAIESKWYTLTTTEAGGGGIGGARQFAVQAGASSPQVWRIVGVVTYAALAFLLLANIIAMVAWGVAMWRKEGVESATQILVQVIAADILSATSAISFWLGSSFGSRQKDEQRA